MADLTRRQVLIGALGASIAGIAGARAWQHYRQPLARVTTLRHAAYDADLSRHLQEGLERYPAVLSRARSGRVVLKPNFVEYHPGRPINTDVRLVGSLAEAFQRLGAAEVVVAEGPGHLRDTELITRGSGLADVLRDLRVPFVDLNVDPGVPTALPHDKTGFGRLSLAATALSADVLVSVAKLKTHHWAGVTLTMKNLFGVVPSAIYGWPKNPLHHAGIPESILDIWDAVRLDLGVIDGIVGMEGDGPIMGTARPVGVVVMGDNLPAVDATGARLMGLRPERVEYLARSVPLGGTLNPARIEILGDHVEPVPFAVLDHLTYLRP